MTGFASSFLHISSAWALASSAGSSDSTSNSLTVLTSVMPSKPSDSSVFLVFLPSGSATPLLSSILISTTVMMTFHDARA